MTSDGATDLVREVLVMALIIGGPVLLVGLAIGLAVSILQAATQVQDQTLSLVPKIIAMVAAVVVLAPWLAGRLVEFTQRMFGP